MKKHLLLWFSSLGAAYEAAHMACGIGGQILEMFPFSSKGHLLLEVPLNLDVSKFVSGLNLNVEKLEVLIDLPEKVLNSYLSLTNPPLAEDLLIGENLFLGDTFRMASQASKFGLEILDLRFMRDTTGHSYFMATGSSELCEGFLHHILPSAGKIRRLKNPHESLREFFPQPN